MSDENKMRMPFAEFIKYARSLPPEEREKLLQKTAKPIKEPPTYGPKRRGPKLKKRSPKEKVIFKEVQRQLRYEADRKRRARAKGLEFFPLSKDEKQELINQRLIAGGYKPMKKPKLKPKKTPAERIRKQEIERQLQTMSLTKEAFKTFHLFPAGERSIRVNQFLESLNRDEIRAELLDRGLSAPTEEELELKTKKNPRK